MGKPVVAIVPPGGTEAGSMGLTVSAAEAVAAGSAIVKTVTIVMTGIKYFFNLLNISYIPSFSKIFSGYFFTLHVITF
jgi:hypothetical protein